MSTRADDTIVNVLSRWLAGHVTDEDVRRELEAADTSALAPEQAAMVEELRDALRAPSSRGDLQRTVRETIEALALGG